ncbi:alpha-glucosidase [Lacticaseibacillus paracasei]|uniref:alpha-glucosidase n=1 Tax=Lacticaseibacillus paracasei TaxID=1597 RepID=UPI00325D85DA
MNTWYDQAIIYQIYPKSFQDSDGDGIGDLNGIRQRIPYLQDLDINAVWLNPVFVSPQVDNGYDVANYYAIDERMGTMADMQALIHELHEAGIRIILDFVLNHTSDQHPWFQDASRNVKSIYRDYYIFSGHHHKRPNNWGSFFGGSVWSPDPAGTGQSYFHLFDQHMPDLNWANAEVQRAMGDVAEFWLNKGIDGLRLDAFIHIAKVDLAQNYPTSESQQEPVIAEPFFANLPNVQRWLRPFCAQIKADFPNTFILGEAASANVNLAVDYTSQHNKLMDSVITFRYFTEDTTQLDTSIPAQYQPKPLDFAKFKQTQVVWQQTLAGVSLPTLYWGNHDMARLATRVAHSAIQARSLAVLMYLQRGIPIIYYGEELGLENLTLPDAKAFSDPSVPRFIAAAVDAGYTQEAALAMVNATHKLPARGPMTWDATTNSGFTSGTPWLVGKRSSRTHVVEQQHDPHSSLAFYKQLIALKKRSVFQTGSFRLLSTGPDSYVYLRQTDKAIAVVAVALSDKTVNLRLPAGDYQAVLIVGDATLSEETLTLSADSAAVFIQEKERAKP